jgi:phosphoglycolate phosphatase
VSAPLVIFDLDGTLIDTAPDLIDSLNHTIAIADLEPVTFDDLTHLVGQGARVMIKRAFELRKVTLNDEQGDALFARFMEHYRAHMPGKSAPFPGVADCLERLSAAGMNLAICTNKSEALAIPLIETLGDSINDLLAANNAGIPSIGVTFGYSDLPMASLQPDRIIDRFDELSVEMARGLMSAKTAAR